MAIGIILLFVGTCIIPAIAQDTEKPLPSSKGNWLYVGGSGPGNYTKIQDAIDNANDGDTVFVYDDSSPYYENLLIEKSLKIQGENRVTTVLVGSAITEKIIVNISADDVSFRNFTIQPMLGNPTGITVYKNYTNPDCWKTEIIQNVTISDIIIRNTSTGIFTIRLSKGRINGNIVENCSGDAGMLFLVSSDNIITNNFVANCSGIGILIDGLWSIFNINNYRQPCPKNNFLSRNTVIANRWGIEVNSGPFNTTINENNILSNHELGIQIVHAYKTKITRNNFMNNTENAYFYNIRFPQFVILKNSWEKNFWDEPKELPVPIHGVYYSLLSLFILLPSIAFDWHPAQKPYDIPGMT